MDKNRKKATKRSGKDDNIIQPPPSNFVTNSKTFCETKKEEKKSSTKENQPHQPCSSSSSSVSFPYFPYACYFPPLGFPPRNVNGNEKPPLPFYPAFSPNFFYPPTSSSKNVKAHQPTFSAPPPPPSFPTVCPITNGFTKGNNNVVNKNSKKRKRYHCKVACVACRKAHAACGDKRPCDRCVARGIKCFDEEDVSCPSQKDESEEEPSLKKRKLNFSTCSTIQTIDLSSSDDDKKSISCEQQPSILLPPVTTVLPTKTTKTVVPQHQTLSTSFVKKEPIEEKKENNLENLQNQINENKRTGDLYFQILSEALDELKLSHLKEKLKEQVKKKVNREEE